MWLSVQLVLWVIWVRMSATSELRSHKITNVSDVIQSVPGRTKRSVFSTQVQQDILDLHNRMRRMEGSSDMNVLTWNTELTVMAEEWAERCYWGHGQPSRTNPPFKHIGQNLYAYTGHFDPLNGLHAFYDEKPFYDYDTGACSKYPCGHYTQVVWADTKEVGCAYSNCPNLDNTNLGAASYLVCNYGPAGNWGGQKPYLQGEACSECSSGVGWCENGLCSDTCKKETSKCECRQKCHNCGTVILSNCTCSCAEGWLGVDCSVPCENTHKFCGAEPGWPEFWCNKDFVREKCPLMCGICKESTTICSSSPIQKSSSIATAAISGIILAILLH
ncbi:hypothetical protein CAPTEDRAFT_221658 [Capitella teleta]|uniref:SCP domain-containing protein n=1 Tax=Capitella teleta TaxID=283909 RepID=R7U3K1_CAPTE|nr:hypothetical protein CAPTEDRAFT_221658 [Capitella teleta]|eukprot:ELU00910.1 hypothetical protein CAPTEDRAFT_221658 [Capitella teleta]